MAGPRNFMTALGELEQAERELVYIYAVALGLATQGGLTEGLRRGYTQARDAVFAAETALYTRLRAALPDVLMSYIDAPARLPDLPAPGAPAATGSAGGTVGTAGLGALPAILWAVLIGSVILRIVAILAVVRVLETGTDGIVSVFVARENTKRFRAVVDAQQRKFLECLRRTGDPSTCAGLFPTPEPTTELGPPQRGDPLMLATGILTGAAALGALGFVGYKVLTSRSSAAPSRVYRARGKPRRLNQRQLRSALLAE